MSAFSIFHWSIVGVIILLICAAVVVPVVMIRRSDKAARADNQSQRLTPPKDDGKGPW